MDCPRCRSHRLQPVTWTQDAVVPAVDGSYPPAGSQGFRCDECGALVPKSARPAAGAQRRPQRPKGRARKPKRTSTRKG
jgi:tRNA(Ile2) C34 agmatinyltransferase TiaS